MEAKYQQLKSLVDNLSVDVEKLSKNNKSAGIRIRKAMLDVKNLAQDIRKDILEAKKS
jgi:outer membrane murein-binding lipoprotein Lpp